MSLVGRRVLVTGGSSYVGRKLCHRLLEEGCDVRALGLHFSGGTPSGIVELDGDNRNPEDVAKACSGVHVVFHLAAVELSIRDKLDARRVRQINVEGVNNVLRCCLEYGVQALVYTSTYGVVFGGQEITEGDESLPYFPLDKHTDEISRSTALAEMEVLRASGSRHPSDSRCLYTCALRPATIYGEGEPRLLPRVLYWVDTGAYRFALGVEETKADWVFVDNLVHAEVLAGVSLLRGGEGRQGSGGGIAGGGWGPVSSGKAYFVTDGQPCNSGGLVDAIVGALGFSTTKVLRVPVAVAYWAAAIAELICRVLNQVGIRVGPVMTRAEVLKAGVQHTFSIERARQDLGYTPRVSLAVGVLRTVRYLRDSGRGRHQFLVPALKWWVAVPVGMTAVTLASFVGQCPGWLAPAAHFFRSIGLTFFRRVWVIKLLCALAWIVHLGEGVYAYWVAWKAGHSDTAKWWFLQTFCVGMPSILLLHGLVS